MASRTHLFASKLHKWIGLLLGLQLLAWTLGGLVMSWIPIEMVRGEMNIAPGQPQVMTADQMAMLAERTDNVISVAARRVGSRSLAEVKRFEAPSQLFDLESGALLSPIDADLASGLAAADFSGAGKPVAVQLLTEEPGDYRGPLPVWQVGFDDADGTRIYVSQENGRVMARRNDYWRFYDFFWMLHIMDYDERENFNNPLIMIASLTAMLFVLSGFVLVYNRFHRRDFGLKPKRR